MAGKNHSDHRKRSVASSAQPATNGARSAMPSPLHLHMVLPSDTAEIHRLQQRIVDQLQANRYSEQDIFAIKLSMEEALVNAMKHGNRLDRSKCVHVSLRIDERRFYIRIGDEGCGFNPADVPDPTCEENIERPCGRGLMLMRHYMSQVRFLNDGHTVVMWKRRNGK